MAWIFVYWSTSYELVMGVGQNVWNPGLNNNRIIEFLAGFSNLIALCSFHHFTSAWKEFHKTVSYRALKITFRFEWNRGWIYILKRKWRLQCTWLFLAQYQEIIRSTRKTVDVVLLDLPINKILLLMQM